MQGEGMIRAFAPKKASEWRAEILPDVFWQPSEGSEPNAFHRWMQEICFGIKWRKKPNV